MTASGPFALGPAMSGSSGRRGAPRSNFAPIAPLGPSASSSLGAGLTQSNAPSLKRDPADSDQKVIDDDAYSEPDDGVEIVDMDDVRRMDWMAPESLIKDKAQEKSKKDAKIKKEEATKNKGKLKGWFMKKSLRIHYHLIRLSSGTPGCRCCCRGGRTG